MSDRIDLGQYYFLVLALFTVFLIFYFKYLYRGAASVVGLLLIVGGGIFNFYSRLRMGCVLDNLYTGISFVNVADIVITLGLLIIVVAPIIIKQSNRLVEKKGGGNL